MIESTPAIANEIAKLTAVVNALGASQPDWWRRILEQVLSGIVIGAVAYFVFDRLKARDETRECLRSVEESKRESAIRKAREVKRYLETCVTRAEGLVDDQSAEMMLGQLFIYLDQHGIRNHAANADKFAKWESPYQLGQLVYLNQSCPQGDKLRVELVSDLRTIEIPDEIHT